MDDIVAKPMSFKALKRMLLEHDRRKIAEAGNASNSGANNLQKIQLTDQWDKKNTALSELNGNLTPYQI